eukprot:g12133.t1
MVGWTCRVHFYTYSVRHGDGRFASRSFTALLIHPNDHPVTKGLKPGAKTTKGTHCTSSSKRKLPTILHHGDPMENLQITSKAIKTNS